MHSEYLNGNAVILYRENTVESEKLQEFNLRIFVIGFYDSDIPLARLSTD